VTTLVTGAGGFIGGALARSLAGAGVPVRVLVRSPAGPAVDGIEPVEGDLLDPVSLRAAVDGCTRVAHLGAQKTAPGLPRAAYHAVNARGTRSLAEAAAAAGVERFVYASSLAVHGPVARGRPFDEHARTRPDTPYRHSKLLGERELAEVAARDGLPVTVLRIPSTVGPGAAGWLPYCRLVELGRLRLIGSGANTPNVMALDDVVAALTAALDAPPVAGLTTYVLGSARPRSAAEFAAAVAEALGRPAPHGGPPALPYRLVLHASTASFRAFGRPLGFALARETLLAHRPVSAERARAELGYAPRDDVEGAVRDMVASFRASGRLASGAGAAA
jgi:nucleoside-diphosphate-sugar epimerase